MSRQFRIGDVVYLTEPLKADRTVRKYTVINIEDNMHFLQSDNGRILTIIGLDSWVFHDTEKDALQYTVNNMQRHVDYVNSKIAAAKARIAELEKSDGI